MANTISILSYTNTFGDWFVNTNALAKENNEFGSNNYIKPTGTLYLNDPSLGLQVANSAIIAGQLQVQGIGSSAYVQNNLRVDTQVYFTNTTLGLTNSGQAIIGKDLLVLGSGTGLRVSNNTLLGGTLTANGITQLNNDLNVSGNTIISNTVYVRSNTYFANSIVVSKDVWTNNLTTSTVATIGTNLNVINNTYTNSLQANASVNTASLTVTGPGFFNTIQSNTRINTALLTVTGQGILDTVQANTRINTSTLTVTGQGILDTVQANTRINTSTLTVTGSGYLNAVQANASVNTTSLTVTGPGFFDTVQANTRINTSTLTVTGNSYTNISIANSSINTPLVNTAVVNTAIVQTNTLNVIGTQYVDTINANTLINVPKITLPTNGFIDGGASGATISANGMSVGTAGLSVQGNFTINGGTIYNAPVFTLSSGTPNPALVYNPGIAIYRNTANASIRWNETNKYWDTLDVLNGNYYRILTDEHLSGSTTSSSSTNVATSLAVSSANTQLKAYTDGQISYISGVDATQNTRISTVEANTVYLFGALNQTNTNIVNANTQLKAYTDGQISYVSGVDTTQNTRLNTVEANTVYLFGALNQTNTNIGLANTQLKAYTDGIVTSANTQLKAYTDGAIVSANGNIQSQFGTVYTFATNAYTRANTSSNSFVGTTGTAVPATGVVTFSSGNGVTVSGSGSTLTINTPQNLRTTDSPTFSSLTLSSPLAIGQGGTGSSSSSGAAINLLNGISNPGVSGYVLATNGSGNYYWTANTGAASGSVAPGTTINSTRLLYSGSTANAGQTAFTTPTYSTSAQLRVYINGVRQFYTEYTETSNTSVTLSSGISSGDVVMVEVDGYIINPYYANNITFTAPQGGIVSTANTIQLAINDLESRKATLASPTFTGLVIAPTIDTNASNTVVATTAWVNNKANSGTTFSHSITGNSGTVTNGVYTSGDQTIAGNKTFSSTIVGSINGNAATVTNGVYTNGTYSNPSWLTSISGGIVSGNITGNASNITSYTINQSVGTGNNVQHNSLGVGTVASGTAGEIRATDNITAYYSDRRLKENIQVIDNPLSKIQNISGVYFNNNALAETFGYKNKSKQIGVIAQEIQNVIPEAVKMAPFDTDFDENGREYSKSGEEYLTVQYEKIIPLLIESIKELKAEIDELKGNNK